MRRSHGSLSPPPPRWRGRGGRSRSPSHNRYPDRREPPTSLLVRNLPKSCRPEDLRGAFRRFGPLRDVYLPNDYYTREPRGFGFVQFLEQADAEEAQYYMNHQILFGREITVVFAQENRKKPAEMRIKERQRSRGFSQDNGRSFHPRGRSRSRSRSQTPPRGYHHRRSPSPYDDRRAREYSAEPPRQYNTEGDHHKDTRYDQQVMRSKREQMYSTSRHPDSYNDERERAHGRERSPLDRSPSLPPSRGHSPRPRGSRSRSPSE